VTNGRGRRLGIRAAAPRFAGVSVVGAQIDHVLVSAGFAAHDARFLDLTDTDHRALLVDLTLHQG
jgi:endonuclease/exonuclease/phosphatase (EEP) superfamily protein YafD